MISCCETWCFSRIDRNPTYSTYLDGSRGMRTKCFGYRTLIEGQGNGARWGKIMRRLLRDVAGGKATTQDTTTLEDLSVLAKLREDEE